MPLVKTPFKLDQTLLDWIDESFPTMPRSYVVNELLQHTRLLTERGHSLEEILQHMTEMA